MKKLSPEKKKHVMIVAGITVAIMAVLYLFVITAQQEALQTEEAKIQEMQGKLDDAELKINLGKRQLLEYQANKLKLPKLEDSAMAPLNKNDWKTWLRTQLVTVQTNRHHDIVLQEITLDPNNEINAELLPKFYFSAVCFRVPVVGCYQDLGKYIADIENWEPHLLRVENITIEPDAKKSPAADGAPRSEKLLATLHIVALVRGPGDP